MQKELLMSNNLFYSSQKWELAASQIFLWIVIQYYFYQPKSESNMLRDAD